MNTKTGTLLALVVASMFINTPASADSLPSQTKVCVIRYNVETCATLHKPQSKRMMREGVANITNLDGNVCNEWAYLGWTRRDLSGRSNGRWLYWVGMRSKLQPKKHHLYLALC